MGKCGAHSIIGGNIRYLESKYFLRVKEVQHKWNNVCDNNYETVRVAEQIKELVEQRDRYSDRCAFLDKSQCQDLIDFFMYKLN